MSLVCLSNIAVSIILCFKTLPQRYEFNLISLAFYHFGGVAGGGFPPCPHLWGGKKAL
jgi:hypothetical protein